MQMLQLENGAQETPSPTSPGSSAASWGSAQPGWHCQGGLQPHKALAMETPMEKGKKQSHTWRIGSSPHIKTKKKLLSALLLAVFLTARSEPD